MKKKLLSLVAGVAVIVPSISMAVGLGSVRTYSHLNERLKAEIPVLSVKQKGKMNVSLASNAEFAKRGVQRSDILNNLRFSLIQKNGRTYVRVSSTKQIAVPYLNFILQLSSPEGVVSREYAIFLDPTTAASIKKKSSAKHVAAKPKHTSNRKKSSVARVASERKTKAKSPRVVKSRLKISNPRGAKYGPVRRGETMWSIASYVRPSTAVNVNDMISALKSVNRGTLSRTLPAGVTIYVPTIEGYKAFPGGYAPMPGTVKTVMPARQQITKTKKGSSAGAQKSSKAVIATPKRPKVKPPKVETPKVETPKVEMPKVEMPKVEMPKVEMPKVEMPKVETPKVETPKVETPKVETPKVETPKVETPKVETPKVETPKVETPKVETPKVETPKVETPKVEAPKVAKPKVTPKPPVASEQSNLLMDNLPLIGGGIVVVLGLGGLLYARKKRQSDIKTPVVLLDDSSAEELQSIDDDLAVVTDEVPDDHSIELDEINETADSQVVENKLADSDELPELDENFDFDGELAKLDEELAQLNELEDTDIDDKALDFADVNTESLSTQIDKVAEDKSEVSDLDFDIDDKALDFADVNTESLSTQIDKVAEDKSKDLDLDADFDVESYDLDFEKELAIMDSESLADDTTDDTTFDFDLSEFDMDSKVSKQTQAVDLTTSLSGSASQQSDNIVDMDDKSLNLDDQLGDNISARTGKVLSEETISRLQMKLDLANSFASIDENRRAKELLNEIINDGTENQVKQAKALLNKLS